MAQWSTDIGQMPAAEPERSPSMGEITMEAYLADMRDEVDAAVAEGLLEVSPADEESP